MRQYENFDTGEVWTEEEIRQQYEMFRDEIPGYDNFEEYIDHLLDMGKQRTGGIIPVEE